MFPLQQKLSSFQLYIHLELGFGDGLCKICKNIKNNNKKNKADVCCISLFLADMVDIFMIFDHQKCVPTSQFTRIQDVILTFIKRRSNVMDVAKTSKQR